MVTTERVIASHCFDCGAPYSGRDLVCSACGTRAYRASNTDSTDAQLLVLRLRGSIQRKERELRKWESIVASHEDY